MFERYIESDDFMRLPMSGNKYRLNINGVVIDINGNKIEPTIDSVGNSIVMIEWINGYGSYKVALLVAFTFKPTRLAFKFWNSLRVEYCDGNVGNIHPSNLVWKYPVGLGSEVHNGFAFIPMFSRYLINRDGAVLDIRSMRLMKPHFNKGYYSYSLRPDIGPQTSLKRHRGICLAFTDYPINVDSLQVNHKNGKPGDDRLDNLEWVTCSENRLHAIKTGLTLVNKPVIARSIVTDELQEFYSLSNFCMTFNLSEQKVSRYLSRLDEPLIYNGFEISYKNPEHAVLENTNKCSILVRDIKTGEIVEYSTITECAKALGVSKHVVNWRINTPTNCLYDDYKQLKRKSDSSPWYIPIDHEQELLDYSWSKKVLVRNVVTGHIREYETQRLAAKDLGISESTIHQWLSISGYPVFKNIKDGKYIQIKNKSDVSNWRQVTNPEVEYLARLSTKPVLVRNSKTSVVVEYPSAADCARVIGVTPTNLNWRLKSNGQQIYKDDLQFKYKDCPNEFCTEKKKRNHHISIK